MPLLFNEKPVDEATILSYVNDQLPKGSNKIVTFVLCNAVPMIRFTEKGERVMKMGGTKPMSTSVLATINGVEGVLTYYTSKNYIQLKNGGQEINYEPKYVYFRSGEMMINADQDKPLFMLMLKNKINEPNAKQAGVPAVYRMVDTREASQKKVTNVNMKLEAYDLVREALKNNKPKIKALYQNLGKSNFNELKAANNWDEIMDPVYSLCESNPAKIIELMKSAALDAGAKIAQAIELNILSADAQGFYWKKNGKKIWTIPAGKADDGMDLFVNFLRNEDKSGVLKQVTTELEDAERSVALG